MNSQDHERMRFHVLGVGSIGSLLAFHLKQSTQNPVRLVLRSQNFGNDLIDPDRNGPTPYSPGRKGIGNGSSSEKEKDEGRLSDRASTTIRRSGAGSAGVGVDKVDGPGAASITVEREGIQSIQAGFEVEIARPPIQPDSTSRLRTNKTRNNRGRGKGASSPMPIQAPTRFDPISSLIITTKSQSTLPALKQLTTRLSPSSTILILQNGLGVIESIVSKFFPNEEERPNFIVASTNHGVWKKSRDKLWVVHAGVGEIVFGILPNAQVREEIQRWDEEIRSRRGGERRGGNELVGLQAPTTETGNEGVRRPELHHPEEGDGTTSREYSNPLLDPTGSIMPPSLACLPPSLQSHSLYQTVAALLSLSSDVPSPSTSTTSLATSDHPSYFPGVLSYVGSRNLQARGTLPGPIRWLTLPQLQEYQLWKLAVNACINPLTAILEVRNGDLVDDYEADRLIRAVCSECSKVFWELIREREGEGMAESDDGGHFTGEGGVENAGSGRQQGKDEKRSRKQRTGRFPLNHRLSHSSLVSAVYQTARATSANLSSTLQDIRNNSHSTEIDYLNGYIVRLGRRFGVDTRTNELLCSLVKLKMEMRKNRKVITEGGTHEGKSRL